MSAREAFEDAGIRGLCLEGRIEAAFAAIEALNLAELLAALPTDGPPAEPEQAVGDG